jgi:hypothetical protein
MEPLSIQDQTDADELVASRIESIYRSFPGGLGEFFEHLRTERVNTEQSQSDSGLSSAMAQCEEASGVD